MLSRGMSYALSIKQNGMGAGQGGRSSVSGVVATVFGGTGFVGRYVINNLGMIGSQVVVPYRCQDNEMIHLKVMGDLGQIVPMKMAKDGIRDEAKIREAVSRSNVVINLVGAEKETWNWRFDEVHAKFPGQLARICAETPSVEKFIHVSCLGAASDAPSHRLRSRYEGERAVRAALPSATVVRLGPVVGAEDRFFNRMAALIKGMPRFLLVDGGANRVQPVWIKDVAKGFHNLLAQDGWDGKTLELGGPATYSMAELHDIITEVMREHWKAPLPVPGALVGPVAGAVQRFMMNGSLPTYMFNPWYTEDGMKEAQTNLVRSPESLGLEDLGVKPHVVTEGRPIEHVRFYRRGGYTLGTTRIEGA